MTALRHFDSKDQLVAEYLRCLATEAGASGPSSRPPFPATRGRSCAGWAQRHAGALSATPIQRGCALANAAIELPEKDHPARRVIEEFKAAQRDRLVALCGADRRCRTRAARRRVFSAARRRARQRAELRSAGVPPRASCAMGEALIASHLAS
jgi:hypothetical protein